MNIYPTAYNFFFLLTVFILIYCKKTTKKKSASLAINRVHHTHQLCSASKPAEYIALLTRHKLLLTETVFDYQKTYSIIIIIVVIIVWNLYCMFVRVWFVNDRDLMMITFGVDQKGSLSRLCILRLIHLLAQKIDAMMTSN